MSDGQRKPTTFEEILEQGSEVDPIFRDESGGHSLEPAEGQFAVEPDPSAGRKLSAYEQLWKLLVCDLPFGELVSEVLRVALELVPSEGGAFFELDFQNQCMFFRAVAGRSSDHLLTVTVPLGQGVVGFVSENQQVLALGQAEENGLYLKNISRSIGFETRNVVAVPVVIRGVTFGCIELLNRLGGSEFSTEDQDLLRLISDCAARIIENRLIQARLAKQAGFTASRVENEAA